MKFSYVALTGDNKKITGVLEAESIETAQLELHKMGVAIIAVNEISEDEYEKLKKDQEVTKVEKGIQTFTFVAVDKEEKEIEGTIDAIDDFSAYKRLRTEYQFKINELYLSSATNEEKEMAKGTLEGFEARVQTEVGKEESKKTKNNNIEEDIDENKELVLDIDNIIINTKELLKTQQEIFSNELLREIGSTLGELERIRTSNNVKHITEVSNNLYELISNPDKAVDKMQNPAYKSILNKLEDSALVKKEFDLYKKTGVKNLFEKLFERIKIATGSKKGEKTSKPIGTVGKMKSKINKLMEQLTEKKVAKQKKPEKPKSNLSLVFSKLMDYLTASTPVLKKVRKKELVKAMKTLFSKKSKPQEGAADKTKGAAEIKKQDNTIVASKKENQEAEPEPEDKPKSKWDFTWLFVEIDSFISWLLCFYIMYFFLVNFSFEKNIGISREFALKTLKSELILNITIFLLIAHFILRIRNMHFRKNFMASLFLVCLGIGAYALLIVNF